jgi:hypothetical protein
MKVVICTLKIDKKNPYYLKMYIVQAAKLRRKNYTKPEDGRALLRDPSREY